MRFRHICLLALHAVVLLARRFKLRFRLFHSVQYVSFKISVHFTLKIHDCLKPVKLFPGLFLSSYCLPQLATRSLQLETSKTIKLHRLLNHDSITLSS